MVRFWVLPLLLLSACGSFSPYTDESQLKFLEELVLEQQQEILAEEAQLGQARVAPGIGCPARPPWGFGLRRR